MTELQSPHRSIRFQEEGHDIHPHQPHPRSRHGIQYRPTKHLPTQRDDIKARQSEHQTPISPVRAQSSPRNPLRNHQSRGGLGKPQTSRKRARGLPNPRKQRSQRTARGCFEYESSASRAGCSREGIPSASAARITRRITRAGSCSGGNGSGVWVLACWKFGRFCMWRRRQSGALERIRFFGWFSGWRDSSRGELRCGRATRS